MKPYEAKLVVPGDTLALESAPLGFSERLFVPGNRYHVSRVEMEDDQNPMIFFSMRRCLGGMHCRYFRTPSGDPGTSRRNHAVSYAFFNPSGSINGHGLVAGRIYPVIMMKDKNGRPEDIILEDDRFVRHIVDHIHLEFTPDPSCLMPYQKYYDGSGDVSGTF